MTPNIWLFAPSLSETLTLAGYFEENYLEKQRY